MPICSRFNPLRLIQSGRWISCCLVPALFLAACGRDSGPARAAAATASAAPRGTLESAVRWERELTLQESDETVNVIVRAQLDPRGGFLIADEQEGFARRYDPQGRLLAQFGGKGSGPGEFMNLLRVLRLPDGTLAAFDIFNKVAFFDSTGTNVVRTARTPVAPLHSVTLLDDSLVVLGGQLADGTENDRRIHVWNLKSDSLLASFFTPALPTRAHVMAAGSAGWVGVDQRGDTLAVVSSLADTVYLMTTGGRMLERIPVPSKAFRQLDPERPLPDARGGLVAAREWFGSFSLMSDVFWVGDTFVVQFQDRTGPQPSWRLVGMGRDGRQTFEVVDSPMLLAADKPSGLLYFVSPESETPNVWRAARLVRR